MKSSRLAPELLTLCSYLLAEQSRVARCHMARRYTARQSHAHANTHTRSGVHKGTRWLLWSVSHKHKVLKWLDGSVAAAKFVTVTSSTPRWQQRRQQQKGRFSSDRHHLAFPCLALYRFITLVGIIHVHNHSWSKFKGSDWCESVDC